MAQSTINAGNIVVPLSEIIDKLQGKLSSADINALLLAITSKQVREVHAGDLITVDFINAILNDIKDLDRRVLLLEAGKPATVKAVSIDEPTTTTVLHIGNPLIISGQGLLVDSLIMIENVPLAGAFGSPDDTTLTIRSIPPLDIQGGLPSAGKSVTLSVSNDLGGTTAKFILKPFIQTNPNGSMTIALSSAPDSGTKYTKSGIYTFKFRVTADTKPDIRFLVTASIGQAGWSATPSQSTLFVKAVQTAGSPTIAEVSVTVGIAENAQPGDTGKLFITLTAENDSSFVWRSTPDVVITVDQSSTKVQQLNLALSKNTAGFAAIRPNQDGSLTGLIGKPDGTGGTGELQFKITRAVDGTSLAAGDYQVDITKLSNLPAGWSASITGAVNGKINLSGSAQPLKVSLTAQNNAGIANLQIELQSLSDATVSGIGEFAIERRS